jgi:hypothetical protein
MKIWLVTLDFGGWETEKQLVEGPTTAYVARQVAVARYDREPLYSTATLACR